MGASEDLPIRAAVLMDHALAIHGLEAAFGPGGKFADKLVVIGSTADGRDLQAILELQPRLVLVDISLKGITDWIAGIRRKSAARIVGLGTPNELTPQCCAAAWAAGADSFLSKERAPVDMLAPLQAVAGGVTVMPDFLRDMLLTHRIIAPQLTNEQVRVWELLCKSQDTKSVADALFVSERTAKRRIKELCDALGVENRAAIVAMGLPPTI